MPARIRSLLQPVQLSDASPGPERDYPIAPLSVRIPIAVKMTGIGRSKLYELIQEGEIDVVKIGSATLIPVASLERLLERHRV
jgi:excisionase family DNA binding protein